MHAFATSFLALYLAHLLTDFVFGSGRLVAGKRNSSALAYVEHGGIHLLSAAVLLGLSSPVLVRSLDFYGVIIGLTVVHLVFDRGKLSLVRLTTKAEGTLAFVAGQLVYVFPVCVAAELIAKTPLRELTAGLTWVQSHAEQTLLLLVVYIGVIFGGGHLVRLVTKPLLRGDLGLAGQTAEELENAGMYIGWLERFLLLTSLLLQSPATAGLILISKSIARYPEFKSKRFAEYFLIGVLLSISIGVVGGLILLKAFYGALRFK
ncbi:MAG TPA: DUF3307 domain-containing protein [Terriglobia bacterium]|nr:DUF3307 domain-containing protein [Terriglobia bacterium]